MREHRAGFRLPLALLPPAGGPALLRPPAFLPSSCRPPAGNPLQARFKNPSKSTLAHDAVAAAVFHKHQLIIRVGAGLIQFVYGSRSHLANRGYQSQKCVFAIFVRVLSIICVASLHYELGNNQYRSTLFMSIDSQNYFRPIWNLYLDRAAAFLTCLVNDDMKQTYKP